MRKRVLWWIGLGLFLLCLAITGFTQAVLAQESAQSQSLQSAVADAMLQLKEEESAVAASHPLDPQVNIQRTDSGDRWAFGAAVIPAPAKEGAYPEGWLFVAKRTGKHWEVGLEGTETFVDLLNQTPRDLIKSGEKKALLEIGKPDEVRILSDQRTGLQLPWAAGQTWTMSGGPHGWTGYDRPYSALDFHGGDQIVRAARGGYAYSMCSNNKGWVRVVHDNGYATDYYHLWDNITPQGSWVSTGAYLGYTGTDVSCGGAAAGRHVHFALRQGGSYVALHGKELGGWVFYEGSAYNGYAMHGSTVRYPGGSLYNYGILAANQGIVDANGGGYVNKRSGPGTPYAIVGRANDGEIVTISCTARGTAHTGRYGTTDLWNRLNDGTWISDAFVFTGTNNPVAPSCQ
jgi:LasA protease